MKASLESQRAAAEAKLRNLRVAPEVADLVSKADAALAEHRAEVAELERQIAQIDTAVGAREHKRRAEEAATAAASRRAQRQALVDLAKQRAAAVEDAEAAARLLAVSLDRVLEMTSVLNKGAYAAGGQRGATAFSLPDVEYRLSQRLSTVMLAMRKSQSRYRFGSISWPTIHTLYSVEENWAAAEEKLVASALQPIIEKDQTCQQQ